MMIALNTTLLYQQQIHDVGPCNAGGARKLNDSTRIHSTTTCLYSLSISKRNQVASVVEVIPLWRSIIVKMVFEMHWRQCKQQWKPQ